MAERAIVDLIVRLKADVNSALADLEKVETAIQKVNQSIKNLETKPIKLNFDPKGLDKGITDITQDIDKMKKLMEDVMKGKTDPAKAARQFREIDRLMRSRGRLLEREADIAKERADSLDEQNKAMTFAFHEALKRAKEIPTVTVVPPEQPKVVGTVADELRTLIDSTREAVASTGELDDAYARASGKIDDIVKRTPDWGTLSKDQDLLVSRAKSLGKAMVNLKVESNKLWEGMEKIEKVSGQQSTAWKENNKLYEEATGLHKALGFEVNKAAKAASLLGKAMERAGEKAPVKLAPQVPEAIKESEYMMTRMDRVLEAKKFKFPFFRAFFPPKDAKDTRTLMSDMEKTISQTLGGVAHGQEVAIKYTNRLTNSLLTAATYTGHFDKRMRYLSRDIYIFGLYAQQVSRGVLQAFRGMQEASADLQGSMEDVKFSMGEVWEPFADAMSPVIDALVDLLDRAADFTDALPEGIKSAVGIVTLLAIGFVVLGAKIIRAWSVFNLFKNSTAIMVFQQRELAAAQSDYERLLVNTGVQLRTHLAYIQQMRDARKGDTEILREFMQKMEEVDDLVRYATESMRNFGGDTSRAFIIMLQGMRAVEELMIELPGSMQAWTQSTEGLDLIREKLYLTESELYQLRDAFLKTGKKEQMSVTTLLTALGEVFGSKGMQRQTDVFVELGKRMGDLKEEQTGVTQSTKKMTRSGWRLFGMFGGMTVSGLMATAVMQEMAPAMETLTTAIENMLAPFQFVFDAIEWFAELIETLSDTNPLAAALLAIATLFGAGLLGKLIAMAIGGLSGLIGSWFKGAITSAGVKGAIGGALGTIGGWFMKGLGALGTALTTPIVVVVLAIIAAIALLWLAWKNNWGNIREHWANFVKWIKGGLEWLGEKVRWLAESLQKLVAPFKEIFGKGSGGAKVAPLPVMPGPVPLMQKGGIVDRAGLAYLHPGETVVPRDLSRSSVTNHIYVDVIIDKTVGDKVDDYQIGRIVSEEIAKQLRRRM